MKRIEIADQAHLSLGRMARIAFDGIRYRLFRASVTVAVIAVAVAFLMNVMSESLVKRSVARNTRERIAQMRLIHDWVAHLTSAGSIDSLLQEVASAPANGQSLREAAAMAGWSPAAAQELRGLACRASMYLTFFSDLDYGRRRNLVSSAVGTAILDRLTTEKGWSRFEAALADMPSIRFVTTLEEFRAFLKQWPTLRNGIKQLERGRTSAIEVLNLTRAGTPVLDALTDAEGAFGNAVRDAGFLLDTAQTAPVVAVQARLLLDRYRLQRSVENQELRKAVGRHYRVGSGDVGVKMMWQMVSTESTAAVYLDEMRKAGIDTTGLSASHLSKLSVMLAEEAALTRISQLTSEIGSGWMGLGQRMGWLLLVSMLVCGIGICNAMLMTVTERFREIATLKCLGALDETIMIMFVMESCLLGFIGGCGGAVLGSLIGFGRMAVAFGVTSLAAVPPLNMILGMGTAVCAGIVLAAIAAVYPAFRAARLAPMEAMRIE